MTSNIELYDGDVLVGNRYDGDVLALPFCFW
jgi:hypothetical protein